MNEMFKFLYLQLLLVYISIRLTRICIHSTRIILHGKELLEMALHRPTPSKSPRITKIGALDYNFVVLTIQLELVLLRETVMRCD